MFIAQFCFVIAISSVSFSSEDTPTLESLIQLHTAGTEMIHAIDMTLTDQRISRNGKPDKKVAITSRWSKEGTIERQRYERHDLEEKDDSGAVLPKRGDMISDGVKIKLLQNWNPKAPPKLHPRVQKGVRASIGPHLRVTPGIFTNPVAQFAMLKMQMTLQDDSRSLAELVKESPEAVVKGMQDIGGHKTWHIQIKHPDCKKTDLPFSGSVYDIYLDPSENYLVRKMICHVKNRGEYMNDCEREVLKFEHYPNGVIIPVEVEFRLFTDAMDAPVSVHREIASNIVINEPLPSDALNFKFPENVVVVETPPVNNKYVINLAQADGSLRRLSGSEELGPFPQESSMVEKSSWIKTTSRVTAVTIGALLIATVIISRFTRLKKKK